MHKIVVLSSEPGEQFTVHQTDSSIHTELILYRTVFLSRCQIFKDFVKPHFLKLVALLYFSGGEILSNGQKLTSNLGISNLEKWGLKLETPS